MSEKSLVPRRRFKGFCGDWEEKKLREVCSNFKSGKTITVNMISEQGRYPVYGGNGLRGYADSYTHEGYSVLIGRQGALCGNVCAVSGKYYATEHAIVVCASENNDTEFLKHLLANMNLNQYSTQSAQPGLAVNNLVHLVKLFPTCLEQTKIGDFFKQLDNLIRLQQKKLDKLKAMKQGYLFEMFPSDGESVPKRRFKGFSGEWEKKSLREIFEYERPDNYIVTSDIYSDENTTPVLTANKAFILGYTNETRTYNQPSIIFDDFTLDCKYVDFPYMVKSSAIKILTTKGENNLLFAFELLNSTNIEMLGHARHYISVVQPTQVLIPTYGEQIKIGNFFKQLDEQINRQQRKLEKLQDIKKAYLSEMFV